MIPQQSYCVSVDQNSKFHLEQIIRLWYRLKSLEKKKKTLRNTEVSGALLYT